MPTNTALQTDYNALNELVVNCPELAEVESLMGGFNLFSVLGFEYGELRHSNALAWLFDPTESHGLGDSFLQRWLMTVLHEANTDHQITPVDVDCWSLVSVEVRREWKHIDLLFILKMDGGSEWVICIENKVKSRQHSNQLTRYREIVEQTFPKAAQKLFLFLTKDEELPDDDAYLSATYTQVHKCLKDCVQASSHSIGNEPRVLIDNYLRLLEEKFMNESDIARLAQKIYKQHKHALDLIYEQRPDNMKLASDKLQSLLRESSQELCIQMESCSKAYIRFIPNKWDQKGNDHGGAWSSCKRNILFELNLGGKKPSLYLISGKSPDAWIDPLWERAKKAPFKMAKSRSKIRAKYWVTLFSTTTNLRLAEKDDIWPDDIAEKISKWVGEELQRSDVKDMIQIIADELPKLDAIHTAETPS